MIGGGCQCEDGYIIASRPDSGGDQSITNSNSNFGAKSLISSGFRRDSFSHRIK